MFRTFRRSWELVKISWGILQQDRELLMFPLIALIGSIIITIIFGIVSFAVGIFEGSSDGPSILGFILLFLYYLANYTVITFSNVAFTGAVLIRMDGGDPTVNDGLKVASSRIDKIIGYAAISATVGMVLNAIRQSARDSDNFVMQIIGSLFAGILEGAWNVVTYLVIPVMVVENIGPVDAIKRSGGLVRDTWGRQVAGEISIGGIFGLISVAIMLLAIPLLILASSLGSGLLIGLVIALALVAIVGVNLVGGALNSIYRLALYRYAHDHKVEYYDEDVIRGAFAPAPA